jgi:hypothetical protein
MDKAEQDKLEFDVRTIVEDAIDSLRLAGLTNQGALKLLMVQASIRMTNAADVRKVLRSIEAMMIDYDGR